MSAALAHDCEAVVRAAALARRDAEDAAWRAEQERRSDLRVAARRAALDVVRVVSDGTWRVLAGDVVLGSLTRTTRETRSGRRRVVVEVIVVGDDWITRDVGVRGGVRFLAYSAALRAHGSAPCHDESLVDAIEARVRVEPIA